MSFRTNLAAVVFGLGIAAATACGGSSNSESNGVGAEAGADSGGGDGGTTGKGGSGAGGTSSGGVGAGSGTGGAATGGAGAVAGVGGCGPCLRIACAPPIWLTIIPNLEAGAAALAGVKVDIPGVQLTCNPSGGTQCQWSCQAFSVPLAGHYEATISAPGFETKTVEFDLTPPTNCGCCGCGCGASFIESVVLEPSGDPMPGCCAAIDHDPNNCGACGTVCASGSCVDGECAAAFGACIAGGLGYSSCDEYCESRGATCSATCGATGDQAMLEWVGGAANCDADPNVTPRMGTCSETFAGTTTAGRADNRCCCGGG